MSTSRSLSAVIALAALASTATHVVAGVAHAGKARPASGNAIEGIDVVGEGDTRQVRIRTTREPTFTVFRLSDPMRVVIDVSGGDLSSLQGPIDVDDGVIAQIATRQFSSEGFLIGRVIVGLERDLAYNVRAEGNAVVVHVATTTAAVERTIPPPVAPVDRAAAERFEVAKRDAETAAGKARDERQQAEHAAADAKAQQQQAERLATDAMKAQKEAQQAKAEAEGLRRQAQEAAARDRAAAEASARRAEARLAELESSASRAATAQAAAERAAAVAEQARRESEETATRAEADHKRRVAELRGEQAKAAKEKKEAAEALARADEARRDAEQAQKRAAEAEAAADSYRQQIAQKLAAIGERERLLADERQKSERKRAELQSREAELGSKETALAGRDRELAEEKRALEAQGRGVAADQKKLAAERERLDAMRAQIDKERQDVRQGRAQLDGERQEVDASRGTLEEERRRIASRQEQLTQQSQTLESGQAEVAAERRAIADDRKKLEEEHKKLDGERRALASDQAVHRQRLEQVDKAEQQLADKRKKMENDAAAQQKVLAELEASRARLDAQEKRLSEKEHAAGQSDAERQQLAAERKKLEQERTRLGEDKNKNREENERLEGQRRQLADVRQGLARDRSELEGEASELDQRRRSLEAKGAAVAAETAALKATADAEARNPKSDKATSPAVADAGAPKSDTLAAAPIPASAAVPVGALIATEPPAAERRAVASLEAAGISPSAPSPSRLTDVTRRGSGTEGSVLLALNGAPHYEVQRVISPPRLVIDLSDTQRATKRTVFGIQSPYVRRVRLGDHGSNVRAVFDLSASNAEHEVQLTDEGLLVTMRTPSPMPNAMPEAVPDARTNRAHSDASPTTAAPSVASATTGAGPKLPGLRDVRFEGKNEVARIFVDVDPSVVAHIDDRSTKAWVLDLEGASVPATLERSLDTSAYGSVVRLVSTYQAAPNAVKVVANLVGDARGKLERSKNGFVWEIRGRAQPDAPPKEITIASAAAPQTAGFAADAAGALARSAAPAQARSKKRISVKLKDAELVNVVRWLAEVTGENIITSDDVTGKVTLQFTDVPWDKALDTILKSKGYDMVRQDNILRIAPAEVIQREREREFEKQRSKAQVEETVIKIVTINYATATDISSQLKPMLSPRGTVQVDDRTNTIVVEDIRSNIDRVVQLTRRLDRQTPQVLIEARIVEASTNQLEHLGIQWGGTSLNTSRTGNATGLVFPSDLVVAGGADDPLRNQAGGTGSPSRYAVNLPAPIGSGSGGGLGFIFGTAGGSQVINLRLSALEESGKGRIVSSPRITTLDNKQATISQGVDIPISVVSAAGVNTRFIQARLQLQVTPHVTNDGSVLMKIHAEKNEPDFANTGSAGDPSIIKKEAETEVLVRDGETTVIGGIYTRNTSESESGVPFLSRIPILGALFKSTRSEDNRTEMLIFVTPRIVNREASAIQASNLEESAPQ